MMTPLLTRLGLGIGFSLLQVLAALPWVAVLEPASIRARMRQSTFWWVLLAAVLGGGVLMTTQLTLLRTPSTLESAGRVYGSLLHLQLNVDALVAIFALLLLVWPKGAAVALAAFREGVRQPMFWYIAGAGLLFLTVSIVIPYFTLGDDFLMLKELGYDVAMLAAVLFGVLAASMSISEEIEGRTAITLMSKPVSRRQFLLGKFFGILLAASVMTVMLGWWFDWVLVCKRWYERMEPVTLPPDVGALLQSWLGTGEGASFCRGLTLWLLHAGETLPGLVLGFCQVMVLVALAAALATRLPMVVNMVVCLIVYFLGHLTPVLVQVSQNRLNTDRSGSPVFKLVNFVAQVFDTVLPSLEFFSTGPALIADQQLDFRQFAAYAGYVGGYACLYTAIVLLIGLVLFEDRDLA